MKAMKGEEAKLPRVLKGILISKKNEAKTFLFAQPEIRWLSKKKKDGDISEIWEI